MDVYRKNISVYVTSNTQKHTQKTYFKIYISKSVLAISGLLNSATL